MKKEASLTGTRTINEMLANWQDELVEELIMLDEIAGELDYVSNKQIDHRRKEIADKLSRISDAFVILKPVDRSVVQE